MQTWVGMGINSRTFPLVLDFDGFTFSRRRIRKGGLGVNHWDRMGEVHDE